MKDLLNRFIRNLTIFTALITVIGITLTWLANFLMTKYWTLLLLLFAGITLIIVTLLFSASEKKFVRFTNTFMIASMVKIMLLLIIIGGYAYKFPGEAVQFSITVVIFYISYLVFEIIWLLKLQAMKKNEE